MSAVPPAGREASGRRDEDSAAEEDASTPAVQAEPLLEAAPVLDAASGVEHRALRGVPWTLLGYVVSRGVSLLGTLALARLLSPGEIGLVATGMVIVAALNLLGDTGLGVTLVVRENLDDRMIGTVFSCMLATGIALAILGAAVSTPLALVFGEPRLASIMPALAVTVVFATVSWFFLNLLQRWLLFSRRFAGQAALAVGYVGTGVPAAAAGAGVWSLVAGQIVGTAASAIVLWRVTPYRLRPAFDLERARAAYRTARAFLSQAFTAFLSHNLHFTAVAGFLGAPAMGVYSMSYRLSELPTEALATPVAHATFPAFAQLRSEHERRLAAFLTSLRYVAFAGLPLTVGLAVLADSFVGGILGPQWRAMPPVLVMLAAWGTASVFGSVIAWYVNATGGANWLARINVFRLVIVTPGVFVAAGVFESLLLVSALLALDVAVEVLLLLRYATRRLAVPLIDIWRAVRTVVLAASALAGAAIGAQLGADRLGAESLVMLAAGTTAGGLAYLLVIAALDRPMLSRGVSLVRKAVAPSPPPDREG